MRARLSRIIYFLGRYGLPAFVLFYILFYVVLHAMGVHQGGDDAEFANNPMRVLQGQVPYRDFWLLFPPGEVLIPAGLFKLFGAQVQALLVLQAATIVLMSLVTYLQARRMKIPPVQCWLLLLVMLWFGNHFLYFLFLWLAAYGVASFFGSRKPYWLVFTGLFAGVALSLRIYQSAPLLIAFPVALFYFEPNARLRWRLLGCTALGMAAPVLACVWYCWPFLPAACHQLLIESVQHNHAMSLPYGHTLAGDWQDVVTLFGLYRSDHQVVHLSGMFFQLVLTFADAWAYLLLPLSFLLGLRYWNHFRSLTAARRACAIFFFIWGSAFLPYAFTASHVSYVMNVLPPFYLLILLMGQVPVPGGKLIQRSAALPALILVPACCAMLLTYGQRDAIVQPPIKVEGRGGCFTTADPDEAKSLQDLLQVIQNNTRPGDYIFVTAWDAPPLYLLSHCRNPTYYDSMIDPALLPDPVKESGMILDLQRHPPRLIVGEPGLHFLPNGGASLEKACPRLFAYINAHFRLSGTFGRFELYRPIP